MALLPSDEACVAPVRLDELVVRAGLDDRAGVDVRTLTLFGRARK